MSEFNFIAVDVAIEGAAGLGLSRPVHLAGSAAAAAALNGMPSSTALMVMGRLRGLLVATDERTLPCHCSHIHSTGLRELC